LAIEVRSLVALSEAVKPESAMKTENHAVATGKSSSLEVKPTGLKRLVSLDRYLMTLSARGDRNEVPVMSLAGARGYSTTTEN
jgi:hypothetical protein